MLIFDYLRSIGVVGHLYFDGDATDIKNIRCLDCDLPALSVIIAGYDQYKYDLKIKQNLLYIDTDRDKVLSAVTYKDFIFNESSLKTFYTEISISERKKHKIQWITKDNQFIELTVSQAYKIADAVSDQIKQIYFDARRKKDGIIDGSN